MQTLISLLVTFATFSGCALLIHCQESHEDTSHVYHGPMPPSYGGEALPPRPFWYGKRFPMLKWFYKHHGKSHNGWKRFRYGWYPPSLDYDFDSKSNEEVNYNQQFPTNSPSVNEHLDKGKTASFPEMDTGIEESNEENSSEEGNENSTENRYHHHHHHYHHHHHHHPHGGRHRWGPPREFHHWKHHWHFHKGPRRDNNDTSSTTENTNGERNETAVTTRDSSEIETPGNSNPSEGPSTPVLELEPRREETTEAGTNNDDAELLPLKALTTTKSSGIPDIDSRNALVVECKKDKNNNCQSEWK